MNLQTPVQNLQPKSLIAGVGHRFWRDRSAGALWVDQLAKLEWQKHITVDDYSFGAIGMMFRLQDELFSRALFITSEVRGREPGSLHLYRAVVEKSPMDQFQTVMNEAGSGVIAVDLLLVVAEHFEALPKETYVLEAEVFEEAGGDGLSVPLEALYPRVLEIALAFAAGEVFDVPVLQTQRLTPGMVVTELVRG